MSPFLFPCRVFCLCCVRVVPIGMWCARRLAFPEDCTTMTMTLWRAGSVRQCPPAARVAAAMKHPCTACTLHEDVCGGVRACTPACLLGCLLAFCCLRACACVHKGAWCATCLRSARDSCSSQKHAGPANLWITGGARVEPSNARGTIRRSSRVNLEARGAVTGWPRGLWCKHARTEGQGVVLEGAEVVGVAVWGGDRELWRESSHSLLLFAAVHRLEVSTALGLSLSSVTEQKNLLFVVALLPLPSQ